MWVPPNETTVFPLYLRFTEENMKGVYHEFGTQWKSIHENDFMRYSHGVTVSPSPPNFYSKEAMIGIITSFFIQTFPSWVKKKFGCLKPRNKKVSRIPTSIDKMN